MKSFGLPRVFFGAALFLASRIACAGAIDTLNRFLGSTRTLRAEFTQTVTAKNGKPPRQSEGRMIVSRPGKFRWEIDRPYSQLIVGDGQKIWMYDPDLNQATFKSAEAAFSGTPAALLIGGKSALDEAFHLREIDSGKDALEWLEAKPKTQESGFEKIRIGFSGNYLAAMEIHDNFGQTTSLRFSRVEYNPAIEPALLIFTPPDGTDILGE
ncbi:MAG: outer membrane lipoprotein chaperone LolA [Candidatus Accumulibacter sp.]|jgi:outer membrane lipoprotein carrier protein|nr:outer membrane lipoprotein chaperone LolA [Accumulibacter sp.]